MAGPQPNENIPFGADMFRSVKGAMSQVQALKKEIRAVDRELAKVGKAVKGVEKFDPLHKELLGKRRDLAEKIRMQEKLIAQQETIRRGQHTVNNEMKETARTMKVLTGIAKLELAKRIASGDANVSDFLELGLLNQQALRKGSKALKQFGKVGGALGAGATGLGALGASIARFIPHAYIAQAIAPHVADAWVTYISGVPALSEQMTREIGRTLATNEATNAAGMDAATRNRLLAVATVKVRGSAQFKDSNVSFDDPDFEDAVAKAAMAQMKRITSQSDFMMEASESVLKDLIGDAEFSKLGNTNASKREALQRLAENDPGVGMRIDSERAARAEKQRKERERIDNMTEKDRFHENEEKKFTDIAWKLRRNPTEIWKGGGFMAHGRYAY